MNIRKFYAATDEASGYGYADDTVKVNPFNFGLNAGNAFLTKFEWINNGGKDGAEQEALDIEFTINGTVKKYRQFPLEKVFGKNNEEITDKSSPEFKAAFTDLNARMTHLLHCFQPDDAIKVALTGRPIKSFKEWCQVMTNLLPAKFNEIPLDIFLQYQWQPSQGQNRTYLDLPKKMVYGAWLKKSVPVQGEWIADKHPEPNESVKVALRYIDSKNPENIHPFTRNGWFMASNFANQQVVGGTEDNSGGSAMNNSATDAGTTPSANTPAASAW